MKKSNIRKFWKITETERSFIFTNSMNFHIELNKVNGSFITGNVYDNNHMLKQFNLMMQIANELKNNGWI
jgi:hypothetical protein